MSVLKSIVFAAAVVALPSPPAGAAEVVVRIANFTFSPAEVTIKTGDSIVWENDDDIPHTIVEAGAGFRSKALDTDDRFSINFTDAREVEYFCGLHPQMRGKVIVKP